MNITDRLKITTIRTMPLSIAEVFQSSKYKDYTRVIIHVRQTEFTDRYESILLQKDPKRDYKRRSWFATRADKAAAVMLYNFLTARISIADPSIGEKIVLSFTDQKYNNWLLYGNEEEEEPFTFKVCREEHLYGVEIETNYMKLARDIKEILC